MPGGNEKRGRKRVVYRIEAKIELENRTVYYSKVHDISMSGVFLESDDPFEAGTKGMITIHLESGDVEKEIKSGFSVTRVMAAAGEKQPAGFALVFLDLDPDSSILLYNIIKYQSGEILD